MEAARINSSSFVEMDSSIKAVEKNGKHRDHLRGRAQGRGDRQAGGRVHHLRHHAIRASSEITSEVIANLSQRAGDLGAILSVIDDVAALNAAIIAAQAGGHGKGFAVVAGEMKRLAERTSSPTRKISDVVNGVLEETARAVTAIAQAEENIAQGETLSRENG